MASLGFWAEKSIEFVNREAYFLFLKEAIFNVDGEETSSLGNRTATPHRQLQQRTAEQGTKTASRSKKSIQGKNRRKIRFQFTSDISTHKSEPCPRASQDIPSCENCLTY